MKVTALEVIRREHGGDEEEGERRGDSQSAFVKRVGHCCGPVASCPSVDPLGGCVAHASELSPKALRMSLLSLSCSWAACSRLSPAVPTQGPCLPPVSSRRAQEGLAGGREGGRAGAVGRVLHPHPLAGPGLLLPSLWSPQSLLRTPGLGRLVLSPPLVGRQCQLRHVGRPWGEVVRACSASNKPNMMPLAQGWLASAKPPSKMSQTGTECRSVLFFFCHTTWLMGS